MSVWYQLIVPVDDAIGTLAEFLDGPVVRVTLGHDAGTIMKDQSFRQRLNTQSSNYSDGCTAFPLGEVRG